MSTNAKPKPLTYQFHPLELSLIGYSGVGKTTLLTRVITHLKERWKLAYVKHDAHAFEMDKEGKDTFRARSSGADAVYISSAEQHAFLADGEDSLFSRKSRFLDFDAVLIEGYKMLAIDKICFLDDEGRILSELSDESRAGIKAFVGAQEKGPDLPQPYFHRDDSEGLASFIEHLWLEKIRARPLKALILAGGRSERMGQDKGLLDYRGKPEVYHLYDVLAKLGLSPVLSVREDQWPELDAKAYRVLSDKFLGLGPLSGLLTAMDSDPNAAWLVLACDLPLLNETTLEHLLESRSGKKMATAYRSMHDGLPEPLCAIYEPKIRMRLFEALGLGLSCPRKVLLNSDTLMLDPIDPLALENANTPEDFQKFQSLLKERTAYAPHS